MSEAKTTGGENGLRAKVLEALVEVAPEIDTENLAPAVSFRDQFGIDSVDFLGFALALGKKVGIEIPELDYPRLSSLQGCLTYLADKV